MTPTWLRECLDVLRWSQRALDCDSRLVRRWAAGQASIAPDIDEWLERAAAFHTANPRPAEWKRWAA